MVYGVNIPNFDFAIILGLAQIELDGTGNTQ